MGENHTAMILGKRTPLDVILHRMLTTEREGLITKLSILHVQDSVVEKEVFYIVGFTGGKWTAQNTAQYIIERCQQFSQDLDGVQRFRICAFYGGRGEVEDNHFFTVNNAGSAFTSGMTEGPDARGVQAQTMRHTEGLANMYSRGMSHLLEVQARVIESQGRREDTLRSDNMSMFEMLKTLMVEQVNNQHEQEMKRLAFQRSSDERKRFLALIPAFANTILGREVIPQNVEDTALVELIADNMKPENVGALAQAIPPELMSVIMQRFAKHEEKKRAENETRQLAAAAEDDIANAGNEYQ